MRKVFCLVSMDLDDEGSIVADSERPIASTCSEKVASEAFQAYMKVEASKRFPTLTQIHERNARAVGLIGAIEAAEVEEIQENIFSLVSM